MDFTVDLSLDEIKQGYQNKGTHTPDQIVPKSESKMNRPIVSKPVYHQNNPQKAVSPPPKPIPPKVSSPPPMTPPNKIRFGFFRKKPNDDSVMQSTSERGNTETVKRNHPSVLSKEAMRLINGNKHIIVGSKGCGHCSNEKQIIDGKYRAIILKFDKKNPVLDYKWDDYHTSINTSKESLTKLEQMYKNNQIKKAKYIKLKGDLEHFIGINEALLNPDIQYDKVRKNYQMFYVDDISPAEEKKATKLLIQAQKQKQPLDTLYKQLRKEPNGQKLVNFIVAKEIQYAYGVRAFPTFINDACQIPKGKDPKKVKDLLSACKSVGFKEGFGILEYDAEQRHDKKTLKVIDDVQKEHKNKMEKNKIPDIMEVMGDLKNIQLTD